MTKTKLLSIVQKSKSLREISKKLKTSRQKVKKLCSENNIDISHLTFLKSYLNKKYNKLTIIKELVETIIGNSRNYNRKYVICLCDCGKEKKIRLENVISGKTKSCGCLSKFRENMQAEKNVNFKGFGKIRKQHIREIIRSAKRRNLEYDLSVEYLWELFIKQDKKCRLSGIELFFGRARFLRETTASLDRIDSRIGYIKSNVQWVHKDINRLKGTFSQDYLIQLCKNITDFNTKTSEIENNSIRVG